MRAVERRFLALRESGLYLSPKDFALLLDWFERGVPAELVISAIEALFSKAAARSISDGLPDGTRCVTRPSTTKAS